MAAAATLLQGALSEMRRCHEQGRCFRRILPMAHPTLRRWLSLAPGATRWHEVSVRCCRVTSSMIL